MRAKGLGPEGRPWRVGIEEPNPVPGDLQRVVELGREALATSGNYRIFFERDGRRYSHIVNPRTGRPVDHDLASATVVAAELFDVEGLTGTLETGSYADIIAVEDNPLDEIAALQKVLWVVKAGQVVKRDGVMQPSMDFGLKHSY